MPFLYLILINLKTKNTIDKTSSQYPHHYTLPVCRIKQTVLWCTYGKYNIIMRLRHGHRNPSTQT